MFYRGAHGWYCRNCVRYVAGQLKEDSSRIVDGEYQLAFELTERQKEISRQLVALVAEGKSVLLEAVCGAGKTELVYAAIADQLKRGRKVGFAISRRQVVLEIAERLRGVFSHLKVVAVCQGHTEDVTGDLIVCTTHQLYRYNRYFDLLIIDEPDAFPFKGNRTLQGFAANACRGSYVYLTATPDRQLRFQVMAGKIGYLYLAKRPSGRDLCLPEVIYGPKVFLLVCGLFMMIRLLKMRKPLIIFTPSIATGRRLYRIIRPFVSCCSIDSTVENRDELIAGFRGGQYRLCISTTVLERGITIPSVSIIVLYAHSGRFDEASLTQMAGRVGRSVADPYGECLFLSQQRSEDIDRCLASIKRANSCE